MTRKIMTPLSYHSSNVLLIALENTRLLVQISTIIIGQHKNETRRSQLVPAAVPRKYKNSYESTGQKIIIVIIRIICTDDDNVCSH